MHHLPRSTIHPCPSHNHFPSWSFLAFSAVCCCIFSIFSFEAFISPRSALTLSSPHPSAFGFTTTTITTTSTTTTIPTTPRPHNHKKTTYRSLTITRQLRLPLALPLLLLPQLILLMMLNLLILSLPTYTRPLSAQLTKSFVACAADRGAPKRKGAATLLTEIRLAQCGSGARCVQEGAMLDDDGEEARCSEDRSRAGGQAGEE